MSIDYNNKLLEKLVKYGLGIVAVMAVVNVVRVTAPEFITVSNSVNGRELPIYCVDTEEKKIALSFDAAWGNEDTQTILDILQENEVHATFFMTGGWVKSYPEDVKNILAAGHDLGNHSENHKNMSQLSDTECKEELMKVHDKVKKLTGYEMFLFRPPYGDYDNEVITNAKECGYYTIQWDVETLVIEVTKGLLEIILLLLLFCLVKCKRILRYGWIKGVSVHRTSYYGKTDSTF